MSSMNPKPGASDRRREAVLVRIAARRHKPWMWAPYAVLWLVSLLYGLGWKWTSWRRRSRRPDRVEGAVVIGVGNITMGGSGKTPVAAYLARRFLDRGASVGIALRGHGRRGREPVVELGPGGGPDGFQRAGDEAALLARKLPGAGVGVGLDRCAVARRLARSGARVVILDDAFQYLTLARDLNILVVDAVNPFGGGAMPPAGMLREPLWGAARADLVWITRSDQVDEGRLWALERRLGGLAPGAALVRSRHAPSSLKKLGNDEPLDLDYIRGGHWLLAAGIGNPDSFLRTVEKLGGRAAGALWYPDHHAFSASDVGEMLARMRSVRARGVLTTQKDAVRLEALGLEADEREWFFVLGIDMEPDQESEARLDEILGGLG